MPENTQFNRPSPVLLSASCDVALGNNAVPDMTKLAYPFRKAVLIDEIRFDMWADIGDSDVFNLGSLIYCKMQIGQNYLMRDPVPVWLLGTQMSLFEEEAHLAAGITPFDTTNQQVSHYRWRLPEPLYVQAGEVLRPVFSRPVVTGLVRPTGNITVQVSYAGRVVPPGARRPNVISVPYAAPFVTTLGVAGGYQQSNEYNLFNPFDQPLRVQRLTGRLCNFSLSTAIAVTAQVGLTSATAGSFPGVLIDDSWGGKVVDTLTGIGDVFDAPRAAWTFDVVMPGKGQYNVRVWNIPSTQQVHIGMIGTRQEAL